MRNFQKGWLERRVGVCAITCSFNRYFSVFASLRVFLEDEARIDAAKPEGVREGVCYV